MAGGDKTPSPRKTRRQVNYAKLNTRGLAKSTIKTKRTKKVLKGKKPGSLHSSPVAAYNNKEFEKLAAAISKSLTEFTPLEGAVKQMENNNGELNGEQKGAIAKNSVNALKEGDLKGANVGEVVIADMGREEEKQKNARQDTTTGERVEEKRGGEKEGRPGVQGTGREVGFSGEEVKPVFTK